MRWGDPKQTGEHGWHRFGVEVTGYGQVDGITFPAAGRVGWLTPASGAGVVEFFRFRVLSYAPIGGLTPDIGSLQSSSEARLPASSCASAVVLISARSCLHTLMRARSSRTTGTTIASHSPVSSRIARGVATGAATVA